MPAENENNAALTEPVYDYPDAPPDGSANGVNPDTIQEIIALSVGSYVVVEFLIGTNNIVRREGVLTAVGVSWLLLYDERNGTSQVCDMYSVKFVTYFDPGMRPDQREDLPAAQSQPQSQQRRTGYYGGRR